MKKLLVLLVALAAMVAPASAYYGPEFWIVYEYDYPPHIVAGPYSDYGSCASDAGRLGYQYHCIQR
jgi:hypothetical protein